jgi:hypothetical protein
MMTQIMNLHERAILVHPSLPVWNDSMENKAESKAVIEKHGAAKGSGKFTQRLMPETAYTERQREAGEEQNAYHALVSHLSAVRQWHYKNTLPWNRDGWHILPMLNYEPYMDQWRTFKAEYDRLRRNLELDWRELVTCAKVQLNGLAKDAVWPNVDDALARFDMQVTPRPVPSADFRVTLGEAELAVLRESAEADMRDMAQQVTGEAAKKLYKCLDRIKETLGGKAGNTKSGYKRFEDTLITNAREICDILTRLNVTDDASLEKYRRETELLAMSEPDTLRENVNVRLETAARAQSIMDDMLNAFGKDTLK